MEGGGGGWKHTHTHIYMQQAMIWKCINSSSLPNEWDIDAPSSLETDPSSIPRVPKSALNISNGMYQSSF